MGTLDIILRDHRKSITALESSISQLTECWKKQRSLNRWEAIGLLMLAMVIRKQMKRISELEKQLISEEVIDENKEE